MDTATINNPPGCKTAGTAAGDRRLRIYICSPYRPRMESAEQAKRELADNIDRAKTACRLVAEASRLGLPVRMFCETTGLLGKVLKRVVSDLYSDADDQDRQQK